MSLTSYLNHLDEQRRADVVSGLEKLPTDDRAELTAYLERLGRRIEHENRFAETYFFAPPVWPSSALGEIANRWADPALRHMLLLHQNYLTASGAAVPIYREFSGVSDVWAVRIPGGFVGELDLSRSVALRVLGDEPLLVNGELPQISEKTQMPEAVVLDGIEPKMLDATAATEVVALLVASPALVDSKTKEGRLANRQWSVDHPWLVDQRAPTTTAQPAPRRGRHGPRSGLAGHPGLPQASSAVPLPPTATSRDQSPPR